MQYSFVLAGATLASFAVGHPHRHEKRAILRETEIAVMTVTDIVTEFEPSLHWRPLTTAEASSTEETSSPTAVVTSTHTSAASPLTTANPGGPIESVTTKKAASTKKTTAGTPSAHSTKKKKKHHSATSTKESTTTAAAAPTGISLTSLSPNGKKAGLSGYVGIQDTSAFSSFAPYVSWFSDYTPNTPTSQGVMGVGMLWGAQGSSCGGTETDRLDTFNSMTSKGDKPDIMFGFYEPDCYCPDSSDMSTSAGASDWNNLLAPLGNEGTILGSPSMCKQYDEDWLTPFNESISRTWDVTALHINKPNLTEAKMDVEYYSSTYGKPLWIAEFACVHDQPSWEPCTDQGEIDTFINDVVPYFQNHPNVVAYGPSNGAGLGNTWPFTDSNGDLTASGTTYLNAVKNL